MISPLTATLWITLIGMGLVFIAILLLWGLMEGMMRISARFGGGENHEFGGETGEEGEIEELPILHTSDGQKKRAAAAAVAIALSLLPGMRRSASPQSTGSAWQAVNRARQLTQSTHITRKS
jgi:Na+-transporting methylmalonyl-CoA/oxaloacetate decarboxylase gamma subunit